MHKLFKYTFIFSAILITHSSCIRKDKSDPYLKLWYNKPAAIWDEALPIGNGHIGAMIYGTTEKDHFQLNDDCFWAGSPYQNDNPEASKHFKKIQELMGQRKYKEGQDLTQKYFFAQTAHGVGYQPAGDLFVEFPGHENPNDYYRELDLNNAVHTSTYKINGVTYKRESFVSLTDDVLVVRISADKKGMVSFNTSIGTIQKGKSLVENNYDLVLNAVNFEWVNVPGKLRLQQRARIITDGGALIVQDTTLFVEKANTALILLSSATNYVNYKDISGDEAAKTKMVMEQAAKKSYEELYASHLAKYQSQFHRQSLCLGITDSVKKPTDIRIEEFSEANDPQMVALYYQYGRYLLITSSQPGTQPANLQGIWNKDRVPAWGSKYTININTEMNYWPAEVANLSEMQRPFIEMVKDLSITGQSTAKNMYGARGWVVHHNTDLWRITGPVDGIHGMTPSCGAWLCLNLWEPWLFNGDIKYLEEIYPVLKGAAEYWLDALWEDPQTGYLFPSPDASPENTPYDGIFDFYGTTMSNQLIYLLFENTITAAKTLGKDDALIAELHQKIEKLPPMKIGQHSQLQEWWDDEDKTYDHHRHVSHLLGLHPAPMISPFRHPELFESVRNSLEYRGDISTGWSMGWKTCLWARLLDGNRVYKLLKNQISPLGKQVGSSEHSGGTFPNLFDAHPPFQIDGNFGCAAGIAEMLIQSHDEAVFILPALPDALKTGSFKGVKARGGFEFDMEWSDGKITSLKVISHLGGNLRLRFIKTMLPDSFALDMKEASCTNENPFFRIYDFKKPIVSENAKLNGLHLKPVSEYDLETQAGKEYIICK